MYFRVSFLLLGLFHTKIICWQPVIERAEVINMKGNISKQTIAVFKYNRTTPALNTSLDLKVDVPITAIVHIKLYGLFSNTYRELPLVLRRKICDFLNIEFLWVRDQMVGYYPTKCPIKKGYYYVHNMILSSAKMPAKAWATNNYLIELQVLVPVPVADVWNVLKLYVRATTDDELRYV